MPLANRPLCHLSHKCEGPKHQLVAEALAPELRPQQNGLFPQLVITQSGKCKTEFVDRPHHLGPHRCALAQSSHDGAGQPHPLPVEPALARHRPLRIGAVQRRLLPSHIKH